MRSTMRLLLAFGAVATFASLSAPATLAAASADAALIQRGHYLAIAGDCTACHTASHGKPYAGGLPIATPVGTIISTNITPSKRYGIGNYTLAQFSDALRKGVRANGAHLYPAMPYTSYAQVSNDDTKALYEYFMKAVAPVDAPSPQTSLPFPFNIRLSMAAWNFLFLDDKPFAPDPGKSADWNRGAYLVRGLTHCSTCHTPRNLLMAEKGSDDLGGGDVGGWYAPNITSDANSGIGGWSEQDLVDYLRTGFAANNAQAAGPMAEAVDDSLRHLSDGDLHAIATYLKTVPAQHDNADTRPDFAWGMAGNDLASVRGVSLPTDPDRMSGPQLYDANCATCHGINGQGASNGALPSLFHNVAFGSAHTNNLVLAILDGVHRAPDTPYLLMTGFANELSNRQIVTLANYLTQRYGNPKAQVTAGQVSDLRSGQSSSFLLWGARAAIIVISLLILTFIVFLIYRFGRRRSG